MKKLIVITLFLFQSCLVHAASYEVKMLDFGNDGGMVFEPGFLKVEPGDTITFLPSSTGHFVRSALLPDGHSEWLSKLDEPFTVTLDDAGVYVYYCPPHLTVAMVGVIQVGEASGKDSVIEEMKSFNRRQLQNKKRLWSYIDQIEWSDE
ncbi:MAG: plastocyanin/azurin family copper-binding protein [Pseudomonadota bacterium]